MPRRRPGLLPAALLALPLSLPILCGASPAKAAGPAPAPGSADLTHPLSTAASPAAAPATACLVPGGLAPDFDYLASPYGWSRFGVLCAEGPVLLVFDPADSVLAALERETAQLEPLGVIVVAVRSRDSDDNWETIRRLGLRFRLFSDPHATLADSFGVAGAPAAPDRPWWCVVGADRRVRTAGAGLADGVGFAAAIAPALGEPAATGAATASD